ncbi:hypothetical protein [Azovibrio restrictus]|uniref:hypothetical protein n=1 Tax=Azovibrio restrictus TaxID=146938 RepID=UPI0026EFD825|nr:hypothetical protein [Azovibrio restrictus]MDD3483794.1 hypothetical protein [Azovibrio restrictus]
MQLPEEILEPLQRLMQLEPQLLAVLASERHQPTCLHLLGAAAARHGVSLDQEGLAAALAPRDGAWVLDDEVLGKVAAAGQYTQRPDPFAGAQPVIRDGDSPGEIDPWATITLG